MKRDTLVLRMIEAADIEAAAGRREVAELLWRNAQEIAAERFEAARRRMREAGR